MIGESLNTGELLKLQKIARFSRDYLPTFVHRKNEERIVSLISKGSKVMLHHHAYTSTSSKTSSFASYIFHLQNGLSLTRASCAYLGTCFSSRTDLGP